MERGVALLAVSPDTDPTRDYFAMLHGDELASMDANGDLSVVGMHGANHVFSKTQSQVKLQEVIAQWLRRYM